MAFFFSHLCDTLQLLWASLGATIQWVTEVKEVTILGPHSNQQSWQSSFPGPNTHAPTLPSTLDLTHSGDWPVFGGGSHALALS